MRFLVTNDDGIESVFLHELVHALRSGGHELYVVAPKREQSWVGAAKSRNRPVHATAADHELDCPTWIIDGTPSDGINIAVGHLVPSSITIDAVVNRRYTRDPGVGELRGGSCFDRAQPPRILGGVLLQRRRILRTQLGQRALNRVGLLDRV